MNLTAIDWAIVAAYFLLSAGIGFAFTKRGGESLSEYFISGRQVPWWLAGASMVATTFAADRPLVVTGLVFGLLSRGNSIPAPATLVWSFTSTTALTGPLCTPIRSGRLGCAFNARLISNAHSAGDSGLL